MNSIHSLGNLIRRLSEAVKVCSVDGDPKGAAENGMPGSDFLCRKTIAKLEELIPMGATESPLLISILVVHGLASDNTRPDFATLRYALVDFKSAAKAEQRRRIEEAYAAAGMTIDNPSAFNEQLLPRLERRRAELVGTSDRMGWIGALAFQCAAINASLGLEENYAVRDHAKASFVELCVAHKTLMREVKRLEALARERQAAEDRKAAQLRNRPEPRPAKPAPFRFAKTSGF